MSVETQPVNLQIIAEALAALGHESRLKAVLYIAERPDEPICASTLCRYLEIPHNKLNFHTAKLKEAGLLKSERKGREIYYSLNIELIDKVFRFMMQDCLQVSDIKYRVSRQATSLRQDFLPL